MTQTTIEIPDAVEVSRDDETVTVEGPQGTVERTFSYPGIDVALEDGAVVFRSDDDRRSTDATIGTFESQIENAFHGVTEGFEYEMAVLYSHFPMQVTVQGDEVEVDNFLGEQHPRRAGIRGDTEVEVQDEEIVLRGPDREDVGQTAANIEQLTYINEKDIRVFQDGIYITRKPEV